MYWNIFLEKKVKIIFFIIFVKESEVWDWSESQPTSDVEITSKEESEVETSEDESELEDDSEYSNSEGVFIYEKKT